MTSMNMKHVQKFILFCGYPSTESSGHGKEFVLEPHTSPAAVALSADRQRLRDGRVLGHDWGPRLRGAGRGGRCEAELLARVAGVLPSPATAFGVVDDSKVGRLTKSKKI